MVNLKQRKNNICLIYGFVRSFLKIKDLINLILLFYEEIIIWKIKNTDSVRKMDKFRSMKNGSAIYGPSFELLPSIKFETTLCSNGWKINQRGSTQFYIELKMMPKIIRSITIYYELACFETESLCKKIRIFKKSTDAQSWGTNNMRLSECDKFKELNFASYCKILRIEYQKNYSNLNLLKIDKIIINKLTHYQWNINNKLLTKFQQCKLGKFFYSDNFGNDCFCIELAPNGWHLTNKGKLMLYLRLLQLPIKILQLKCYVKFKLISNNNINISYIYKKHIFSYKIHGLQFQSHSLDSISIKNLKNYQNLKINLEIKIIEAIDINNNKIPKNEWIDFDIF